MFDLSTSFPGKERDEAVYIFARPYFWAFLPQVLIFSLVFLLAAFFQAGLAGSWFPVLNSDLRLPLIFGLGILELGCVVVFFTAILEYYCDILIVTDRRVVEINQEQLFYRHISELNLLDVEDTNSTVQGVFATFLGFGTVNVQTAGEQENFNCYNLRYPREITSIISELAQQAKDGLSPHQRGPENSRVIAVIDNKPIASMEELARSGAINTDDPRRTKHIARWLDHKSKKTSPASTEPDGGN